MYDACVDTKSRTSLQGPKSVTVRARFAKREARQAPRDLVADGQSDTHLVVEDEEMLRVAACWLVHSAMEWRG